MSSRRRTPKWILAGGFLATACATLPPSAPESVRDREIFSAVLLSIRQEADSMLRAVGDTGSLPMRVVPQPMKKNVWTPSSPAQLHQPSEEQLAPRRAAMAELGFQEGAVAPYYGGCPGPLVPPLPGGTVDRSRCPAERSGTVSVSYPTLRTVDSAVVEAGIHWVSPAGPVLEGREYILARNETGGWSVVRYTLMLVVE